MMRLRFINRTLDQLLLSSAEISIVPGLLYYPQSEDSMPDQCFYNSSYQEEPPPYDRAIQESSPYSKCLVSEFSSEQSGSPPPNYQSLV